MINNTPDDKKILIVDDEKTNIDILRNILKNYNKIAALDGNQALRVARSDLPPDLILLDIMMPGLDGYEVCRQLKADAHTKNIPVIFITAKVAIEDEIKGFSMGAVDYITKPISPPVVLARVETHLALRSAYRSLEQQHETLMAGERYIRSLIDHALEMIVSLDTQFNIVEFNAAAENAFGYTAAEVKNRPFRDLVGEDIKFDLAEGLLVSKGLFTGEMAMVRKNGETLPVFLKFNRLVDGEGQPTGAIGNMRDMTAEKLLAKLMRDKQNNQRA